MTKTDARTLVAQFESHYRVLGDGFTFSPGLLVFSLSGLQLRADSSADSGWQMSWRDFCPDEGSDLGVPVLIAQGKRQFAQLFNFTAALTEGANICQLTVSAQPRKLHWSADS